MFNNTKLFAYFYIQLVFVNFVYKKCYLQVKQEDIMDIGNKLKELRVLKGLTQEELADRSELSKGFISQLERNLTSHHHPYGHPAVPWYQYRRVFQRGS